MTIGAMMMAMHSQIGTPRRRDISTPPMNSSACVQAMKTKNDRTASNVRALGP